MKRGIFALGVLLFAMTGCVGPGPDGAGTSSGGPSSGSSAPGPSASGAAADALARAVTKTAKESAKFSSKVTVGALSGEGKGAFDPNERTATMTGTIAGQPSQFVLIGQELFMQTTAGAKWMRLDLTKLPVGGQVRQLTDPSAHTQLLLGVATVDRRADGTYTGTIDVSKAVAAMPEGAQKQHAQQLARELGDKGQRVPFEATVNDRDLLTRFKLTTEVRGQQVVTETTLSDFGTKVDAAKPAPDRTEDASAWVYQLFRL